MVCPCCPPQCTCPPFSLPPSCGISYMAVDITFVANSCPGTWNHVFILSGTNDWYDGPLVPVANSSGCVLRMLCRLTCNVNFGFVTPVNSYRLVLAFQRLFLDAGNCCRGGVCDNGVANTAANVVFPSVNNDAADCCISSVSPDLWDRRTGDTSLGPGQTWTSDELFCGGATLTINAVTLVQE